MRRKGVPLQLSGIQSPLPVDGASRLPLLEEEPWPSTPVFLNGDTELTINRFLSDVRNAKLLHEGGSFDAIWPHAVWSTRNRQKRYWRAI